MTTTSLPEGGVGSTSSRPRRGGTARRLRPGASLGVLPFLTYVGLFFLVPIGFILWEAFRRTTTSGATRDPVTQQFVHTTHTSFTTSNVTTSLKGIYATSMVTSLKLSIIVAVVGAVLGLLLAYAVATSRSTMLRSIVTSGAAVMANFGGIPLAFLFIATLDSNIGVLTTFLQDAFGFSLRDDLGLDIQGLSGIALVYLYFLTPLMVLVMTPALDGLKPQWLEASQNLGATRAQYWRMVAAPVLLPSFLGSVLLLFCSSFSAFATAYALNSSFPLVTTRIKQVLSGNVLPGQENLGAALALDMIAIVVPLTVVYLLLQRRTSKWVA